MHATDTVPARCSHARAAGHARRSAAVITAALALAALAAAVALPAAARSRRHPRVASDCGAADTPATSAPIPVLRAAVVCLINGQRTSRGLPPLRASARLDRSAQAWSNVMVGSGYFGHGGDLGPRISATGFRWSIAGENIASGYLTARQVVHAWIGSVDHCHNILDPEWDTVGTGVNRHPIRGTLIRHATWTQDFALALDQPPPSGDWGPYRGCPY